MDSLNSNLRVDPFPNPLIIISQRPVPPQFAFNQAAGTEFLQNPDPEGADVDQITHLVALSKAKDSI
jgi:hypothetical protein